ncbi:MAG: glutaredoxin family protein [Hahellaceae bacterium]|nr:glutaredoxin family protein [Hahellaceae bacterium]
MSLCLELYGTLGCHLCDQAEAIILAVLEANPGLSTHLQIEAVDIAESDALIEAYGERIPVLKALHSGEELCWPFDPPGLVSFINRYLSPPD